MTDDFSWLEPMDKLIEEIKEETKQFQAKTKFPTPEENINQTIVSK